MPGPLLRHHGRSRSGHLWVIARQTHDPLAQTATGCPPEPHRALPVQPSWTAVEIRASRHTLFSPRLHHTATMPRKQNESPNRCLRGRPDSAAQQSSPLMPMSCSAGNILSPRARRPVAGLPRGTGTPWRGRPALRPVNLADRPGLRFRRTASICPHHAEHLIRRSRSDRVARHHHPVRQAGWTRHHGRRRPGLHGSDHRQG